MNRVAVVTGSGRGIGKAIARRLAADGMDIALIDISNNLEDTTGEIAGETGRKVIAVKADLSDEAQILEACNKIKEQFGEVDTLVNVAGVAWGTPFEETSAAEWDKVFAINLKSGFLLAQQFIGKMKDNGFGRIISISSMAGVMGSENAGCHYCASKAGVIGLVKYLSKSYARYGITANAIAPGPIESEMVKDLGAKTYQNLLDSMPAHKLGTPEQIAAVASMLASEEGGFVTGTVIEASGGQLIV